MRCSPLHQRGEIKCCAGARHPTAVAPNMQHARLCGCLLPARRARTQPRAAQVKKRCCCTVVPNFMDQMHVKALARSIICASAGQLRGGTQPHQLAALSCLRGTRCCCISEPGKCRRLRMYVAHQTGHQCLPARACTSCVLTPPFFTTIFAGEELHC